VSAAKTWTAAEIRALGVRVDGVTACKIAYGVGRTSAYSMLRAGQVDFKVIKIPGSASNRYVVPTSELLRLLCLDDGGDDT
jgi:hypothetical protein